MDEFSAIDFVAYQAHIAALIEKNPENDTFFRSMLEARRVILDEGLAPKLDANLGASYTAKQGVAAAVRAREDVAAVAIMQSTLLVKLDKIHKNQIDTFEVLAIQLKLTTSLRRLAWAAILLLGYIAVRVS